MRSMAHSVHGDFARGGTGAISNAIADAAREAGVEIRTQAGISQIMVKNGKAKGVVLANGDETPCGCHFVKRRSAADIHEVHRAQDICRANSSKKSIVTSSEARRAR